MKRAGLAGAVLVACLGFTSTAHADQSIIKSPGDHPDYRFEAEPHALIGFGGPFHHGHGELGAGFRGTINIVDGFIPSINNNIGVGFGLDFFFPHSTVFIPVVMQWNFWLTNHWSVFGEPGLGFALNKFGDSSTINPLLYVGGRYHFTDKIALTMRIGYPYFSVGASFFF